MIAPSDRRRPPSNGAVTGSPFGCRSVRASSRARSASRSELSRRTSGRWVSGQTYGSGGDSMDRISSRTAGRLASARDKGPVVRLGDEAQISDIGPAVVDVPLDEDEREGREREPGPEVAAGANRGLGHHGPGGRAGLAGGVPILRGGFQKPRLEVAFARVEEVCGEAIHHLAVDEKLVDSRSLEPPEKRPPARVDDG